MADIEDKIRAKAHELWLADGQPDGKADEHWQAAEAIVRAEAETKPKTPRKPRTAKAATAKEPTAKAAAPKKAAAKEAVKKEAAPKRAAKKPELKVVSDKDAAA